MAIVSDDWSSAQYAYFLRAAQHSARSLDLQYAVMRHVANGTLKPAEVVDAMRTLIDQHGTAYGGRLAEMNGRFLSRLLQISSGSDEPPPMFDPSNAAAWFPRLAEYIAANSRRTARRYQIDAERAVADGSSVADLQSSVASRYSNESAERFRAIGGLYFDLLREMADLNAALEHEYFTSLLAPGQPDTAAVLTAPLGHAASAALTIENTRPEPASIFCTVSDLRRADGAGPAFNADATVNPDVLVLEPGSEATVQIALQLDPQHFDPDNVYVGAVHVSRQGEPSIDIPVRVVATRPAADGQR